MGAFQNLTNLESLNLEYNQLTGLPVEIGNLTRLKALTLRNNRLTTLPSEIGNLRQLEIIYLNNNQLTGLPSEIRNLTNLKSLNLSFNQLTELPVEIVYLTQLRDLILNNNQLTTLPSEIGNMRQLQYLVLGGNQLETLPSEIGNLTQLSSLDLNDTQLTALPVEIGNLTNLESLDLRKNQLTTLPEGLINAGRNQRLFINAANNGFLPEEANRINGLCEENNIHFSYNMANHNTTIATIDQTLNAILPINGEDVSLNEKNEQLREFTKAQTSDSFKEFLTKTLATGAFRSNDTRKAFCNSLREIISVMKDNAAFKNSIEAEAIEAIESRGDRVALGVIKMQKRLIAHEARDTQNPTELYDNIRTLAIIDFLFEKGSRKVESMGGSGDNIETYLAYFKIASKVGVELPAGLNMLYQVCSAVSDAEIEAASKEIDSEEKIREKMLQYVDMSDSQLGTSIMTEIIDPLDEIDGIKTDTSPLEHENAEQYNDRLEKLKEARNKLFLETLEKQAKISKANEKLWNIELHGYPEQKGGSTEPAPANNGNNSGQEPNSSMRPSSGNSSSVLEEIDNSR